MRRLDIGWSLKIGRLFGADLRLHWMFLALAPALAISDLWQTGSVAVVAYSMTLVGVLFLSVLLHEIGHALAGIRAGGTVEQILIWPLGGLAEIAGVPPFPRQQIWLALSGPLVNLMLACGFFAGLAITGTGPLEAGARLFAPVESREFWHFALAASFWVNLFNFGFNMLPVFPLDGGSIFRWALVALFPDRGYPFATFLAVKVGKVTAVLTGIAGIALHSQGYAFLLLVFALLAYLFCERERKILEYEMLESSALDGLDQDEESEFDGQDPVEEQKRPGYLERWRESRRMRQREIDVQKEVEVRKKVDALLDKISRDGIKALTEREKAFLKEASKRYQKDASPP